MSAQEMTRIPSEKAGEQEPYCTVFAAELERADKIKQTWDRDLRLITMTGVALSRIWICGTLTSYEPGPNQGGVVRIADPTGVISLHLRPQFKEYYPDSDDLIPPIFLSATGNIECNPKNPDEPYRILLESCSITDRKGRDAWILSAAESLSSRLGIMNRVLSQETEPSHEMSEAISHYQVSKGELKLLGEKALKAVDTIKEITPVNPVETIMALILEHSGPKGIHIDELNSFARRSGIPEEMVKDALRMLIAEDEVYQPSPGLIKLL